MDVFVNEISIRSPLLDNSIKMYSKRVLKTKSYIKYQIVYSSTTLALLLKTLTNWNNVIIIFLNNDLCIYIK